MAKRTRPKPGSTYRTVGRTYDGVDVLAPKTRSKTFTAAEVKRAIAKAMAEIDRGRDAKPLRDSDALRIQQRDDGRFEVKRAGAKRASAITQTQKEAVERARELEPGKAPIAKRVRRVDGAKRGTWRKA